MRTVRIWAVLSVAIAVVVAMVIGRTVAQIAPGDPLATATFADASGGDAGSARGGDGGRGGSGVGPVCNQNTNVWATEDEPRLICGAGGAGGDGGKGGESRGGNGGIAFAIGGVRPTTTTTRNPLADVFIRAIRLNSFDIDISNNGPDAANGVTLTVTMSVPVGPGSNLAMFDSVTTEHGTCTGPAPGTPLDSPITLSCQLGGLAVGEVATVVIDWRNTDECQQTATVNATVSSTSPPDPVLNNNAGSASQTLPLEDFC